MFYFVFHFATHDIRFSTEKFFSGYNTKTRYSYV
jgi:hypothetical protein